MPEKSIEVRELKTHFYTPEGVVKAVDGVSFEIDRGQALGVLGESGSGKSVTALSIMGLIPNPPGKIVSGEIFFQGQNLVSATSTHMRKVRGNRIAMIFQEPMTSLNPVFTIGNQISEMYVTHENLSKKDALLKAVEILGKVGIPSPEKRINEYPHQLSGGMRQRSMIAMAMSCRPNLLIADEPTTALDVTIQAQILDLMLGLQVEFGMSIMIITHNLGVIAEVSDKVVVMYAGEVAEYSTMERLFTEARHPYTIGLMESIPKLGARFVHGKQPLPEIPGVVPNLIRLPAGCVFEPRCSFATARCRERRPPLFSLDPDHGAKCWLVEREAKGNH